MEGNNGASGRLFYNLVSMAFVTVEEAIEETRAGRMLVVVDDEDRENEGDLTHCRRKDHARNHQFHGHSRPRPDLPRTDRRPLRLPAPSADDAP